MSMTALAFKTTISEVLNLPQKWTLSLCLFYIKKRHLNVHIAHSLNMDISNPNYA